MGLVNNAYEGIYKQPAAGPAEVVTDESTPVPDETGETFTDTRTPWLAAGVTGFLGLSNTCLGVPQPEQVRGIYLYDGGTVERIADNCRTGIPGGQPGELFTNEIENARPVHDGTHIAFWGAGDSNTQGVFTTLGGSLPAVANTGSALPGGEPGEVFGGWLPAFQQVAGIEDDSVVFVASGDLGTVGIFHESAGTLEMARDLDDPLPDWQPGELLDLDADLPALARLTSAAITFYAIGDMGSQGIYRLDGGDLQTVVTLGDTLDGATVTAIFAGLHAQGDRVGFGVELSGGSAALFVADLPFFTDGFESGDTTAWSTTVN